jgi:hypothetical protein
VDQCSDKSIDGTWYGWEWSMHVCCCAWIRIRGVGGKEHTCVSMSNGADILFVCSFCVQQEFRPRKRDIFIKMQTALQAYARPAELCYGASASCVDDMWNAWTCNSSSWLFMGLMRFDI